MWDPRLKSQRVMGSEREAGCDCSSGTSKSERVAMPPDARRAVDMLRIWVAWVAAGLGIVTDMGLQWTIEELGEFDCG
jgi:hypothetical protein